MTAIHFTVL